MTAHTLRRSFASGRAFLARSAPRPDAGTVPAAFALVCLLLPMVPSWTGSGTLQAQEAGRQAQAPAPGTTVGFRADLPPSSPEDIDRITPGGGMRLRLVHQLLRGRILFPPRPRFKFEIDPKTPVQDLLPTAAGLPRDAGPVLADDLSQVPLLSLRAPLARDLPPLEAMKRTAHEVAKAHHLNQKRADRFMEELLAHRPDLAGLPVVMGNACRLSGERGEHFAQAAVAVRGALVPRNADREPGSDFWEVYRVACTEQDKDRSPAGPTEAVTSARVAALMQILAPESPSLRLGLVEYLAGVSHAEATRALARLAVFSGEAEVRQAAVRALKGRRERDYTDVLVNGLRYPWPPVAGHASEAVVKLQRKDLVPRLVDLLEAPDPRAPAVQNVIGNSVPVVRELVRINHHHNCLLCHAPGTPATAAPEGLTVPIPVPSAPLPSRQGYGEGSPDIHVRMDVTYLRQDFSVYQTVADAKPWPEKQRFDFLVRTRTVTGQQAEAYRRQLTERAGGGLTPYQQAALTALRGLTGRDAGPTADAWRRLLGISGTRH